MKLSLPLKLESAANARDGHWAQRLRRTSPQRSAAALAVKAAIAGARLAQLEVTLTRISPGTLDDDNLRGALKAVRDGVASALRIDDASPLVRWLYEQRHGDAKQYGVEIEINSALPTGSGAAVRVPIGTHMKLPDASGSVISVLCADAAGAVLVPNE